MEQYLGQPATYMTQARSHDTEKPFKGCHIQTQCKVRQRRKFPQVPANYYKVQAKKRTVMKAVNDNAVGTNGAS